MRFSQDQFLIGVTGVIFNENNEVLVFKHTYRQTQWSLPGGYIKSKEHPFKALEREILEESGFIVSSEEQLRLRSDKENARLDISIIGKHIRGKFKPSAEVSEFGFFAIEDLPAISKNQLHLIESALLGRKFTRSRLMRLQNLFVKFKRWFI